MTSKEQKAQITANYASLSKSQRMRLAFEAAHKSQDTQALGDIIKNGDGTYAAKHLEQQFKGWCLAHAAAPGEPDLWRMVTPQQGNIVYLEEPEDAAKFIAMGNREVKRYYTTALLSPAGDDAHDLRTYRKDHLCNLMSSVSEICCRQSWREGNEFRLWSAVINTNDNRAYGYGQIDLEDIEYLRKLCSQLDGWFMYSEEDEDPLFVPMAKWKEIYQTRSNGMAL